MFMAAEDFYNFILAFLARLLLIITYRTYLDPILKNIDSNFKKLAK